MNLVKNIIKNIVSIRKLLLINEYDKLTYFVLKLLLPNYCFKSYN